MTHTDFEHRNDANIDSGSYNTIQLLCTTPENMLLVFNLLRFFCPARAGTAVTMFDHDEEATFAQWLFAPCRVFYPVCHGVKDAQ